MRAGAAAALEARNGEAVVLEQVAIRANVDDMLAEFSIEQSYRNPTDRNIEAVYTFPLPLDAVFLGFEVEIGGRRLAGRIFDKRQAEDKYENAIADGDAAILLEQPEPGLYTASVGNLLAGETAKLRFRYTMLLRWNGDHVRLMIPTTIAPRYGTPGHLREHQVPEHNILTERSFGLEVSLRGLLRDASISSPSHSISIARNAVITSVTVDGDPPMDRDFVLEANLANSEADSAIVTRDREGWVALASFRPTIPAANLNQPRGIKIVVDCSGSMAGDSIAQAKEALELILGELRYGDWFDVIAFGSRQSRLFGRLTRVTAGAVAHARDFIGRLNADMGGTELRAALAASYADDGIREFPLDLLLITDGEVWDKGEILADGRASGHRVFTVGVGSSVSERLVRELAAETGGACELVIPNEGMAHRIHRHFRRIYATVARQAEIQWPSPVARRLPDTVTQVFDGDTIFAYAWFNEKPSGRAALCLTLADGRTARQEALIRVSESAGESQDEGLPVLARLAAQQRIEKEDPAAAQIALQYQLMSPWTNCVVVDERSDAEKADDLPETIKVSQTLAAGWHGTGSVHSRFSIMRSLKAPAEAPEARRMFAARELRSLREDAEPARHAEPLDYAPSVESRVSASSEQRDMAQKRVPSDIARLSDLADFGVPSKIIERLRALVDLLGDEATLVSLFIEIARLQRAGQHLGRRELRPLLLAISRRPGVDRQTFDRIRAEIERIVVDCIGMREVDDV